MATVAAPSTRYFLLCFKFPSPLSHTPKFFEIVINPITVILIFQHSHLGRLVSFSVVLLILHDDGWIDVGPFDSAHGTPHQDILGKTEILSKVVFLSFRRCNFWRG